LKGSSRFPKEREKKGGVPSCGVIPPNLPEKEASSTIRKHKKSFFGGKRLEKVQFQIF
jgi:hypothetical protein